MDAALTNLLLNGVIRQRQALAELRHTNLVSRTGLEVLSYAKRHQMTLKGFSMYSLRKAFSSTNVQQLRASLKRLEGSGLLERISTGVKGNPSIFMITRTGEKVVNAYLSAIVQFD